MRQILIASLVALSVMGGYILPSSAQVPAPLPSRGDRPNRPNLNLTDAQKQQMRALRASSRQRLQAVLTPAQRSQLESARQAGQSGRGVIQSLNLSDAQKQQMRAIRQEAKQQRLAILNPAQRAQLEQWQQNRADRRLRP